MKDKSYQRHIAKAITWRIIGTIDTILLSWFISGSATTGLQIGLFEVFTKMLLYYFHERLWFRVKLGIKKNGDDSKKKTPDKNRYLARHWNVGYDDLGMDRYRKPVDRIENWNDGGFHKNASVLFARKSLV